MTIQELKAYIQQYGGDMLFKDLPVDKEIDAITVEEITAEQWSVAVTQ